MAEKEKNEQGAAAPLPIQPPNMGVAVVPIVGISPLVVHRFYQKAAMMASMAEGQKAKNKGKVKPARDFGQEAEKSKHVSEDGWEGVCATAFRAAMLSACRTAGREMKKTKQCIFILADGTDRDERVPLVRIWGPGAVTYTTQVRIAKNTVDIRARPMYEKWGCVLNIRYDKDQFSAADLEVPEAHAGARCGICEGRSDTTESDSPGLGFGHFEVVPPDGVDAFRRGLGIA